MQKIDDFMYDLIAVILPGLIAILTFSLFISFMVDGETVTWLLSEFRLNNNLFVRYFNVKEILKTVTSSTAGWIACIIFFTIGCYLIGLLITEISRSMRKWFIFGRINFFYEENAEIATIVTQKIRERYQVRLKDRLGNDLELSEHGAIFYFRWAGWLLQEGNGSKQLIQYNAKSSLFSTLTGWFFFLGVISIVFVPVHFFYNKTAGVSYAIMGIVLFTLFAVTYFLFQKVYKEFICFIGNEAILQLWVYFKREEEKESTFSDAPLSNRG